LRSRSMQNLALDHPLTNGPLAMRDENRGASL